MDKGRSLSTPVRKAAHSQAVAVYGKAYFKIGVRHAIYPVWLMLVCGAGILS